MFFRKPLCGAWRVLVLSGLAALWLAGELQSWAGPLALEAEKGVLTGNAYVSTAAVGYSGTGYVTGLQSTNDTINWSFTNQAGLYEVFIRFRSQYGPKGYSGVLNGHGFDGMFPSNSAFSSIDAGLFEVVAGTNALQIGGGWNYYEIDRVDFTPTNVVPPLPVPATLTDPQATFAARALMTSLVADYGRHTWAGQHDASELNYIQNTTGRKPALVEGDLIDYSPTRVQYGGLPSNYTESYIALESVGHVLGLCWHWNAPTNLLNTTAEPWWKGFYTEATTFDVAAAMANTNSTEYAMILRDMDAIAVQLKKVSAKNIPVLWRPLHESDGGWFWWGAKGPGPFKALWRLLYNRLTVQNNLHNLIWVLSTSDPAWYPGDDVVDIVGVDAYPSDTSDALSGSWQGLKTRFDGLKLLALTEFGGVPDVERMHAFGVWWSYFSPWAGSFIEGVPAATTTRIYQSPEVITLDELNAIPPQISGGSRAAGGAFQLSGTGPRGAGFRVIASTNLALPRSTWPVLTNGTLSGGVFNFSDTQATNYARRFYHVVMP